MKTEIRKYIPSDCGELYRLFYDTVHFVAAKDYSADQLDAWAPENADLKKWNRSFKEKFTLVALADGKTAGFGNIDETGYLDMLYVHKDYQNMGIASALCNRLEAKSAAVKITVHASVTAKPFFEKRGYAVIKEQQVIRRGVLLTNYIMEKKKP